VTGRGCYDLKMSAARRNLAGATYADLEALGDVRAEIIHGSIVQKASPSYEHGDAQSALSEFIRRRYYRRPGGRWPGGWWIASEVDVEYAAHELFRHDVAGWRRDGRGDRPKGRPVRIRPDWVCEILSPSNTKRDRVDKFEVLREAGVPHYWILDPEDKVLTVHRLQPEGYLVLLAASTGQTVRAEPFHEVELPVGVLFGDEDEEE
jgi:Uma2 family endonuclease